MVFIIIFISMSVLDRSIGTVQGRRLANRNKGVRHRPNGTRLSDHRKFVRFSIVRTRDQTY